MEQIALSRADAGDVRKKFCASQAKTHKKKEPAFYG
jgi:hypothetical protein